MNLEPQENAIDPIVDTSICLQTHKQEEEGVIIQAKEAKIKTEVVVEVEVEEEAEVSEEVVNLIQNNQMTRRLLKH